VLTPEMLMGDLFHNWSGTTAVSCLYLTVKHMITHSAGHGFMLQRTVWGRGFSWWEHRLSNTTCWLCSFTHLTSDIWEPEKL